MFDLANDLTPLFEKMEPWVNLKIQEFHTMGYQQITQEDLWHYLVYFSWKKTIPERYYQQIQHVMTLTPNDYLDFASVEALISPAVSLDEMDIKSLF